MSAIDYNNIGATKITDGVQDMVIDLITGASVDIPFDHHEIHEGDSFFFAEGIQLNNAAKEYLITTPDTTKYAHMVIEADGAQDTSLRLAENTGKTGGTTITAWNRDRNSETIPTITLHHSPSGSEGSASVLLTQQWGVATQGSGRGTGGGARGTHEIVLKRNTKYSLTVTALSANPNNISVRLSWYEHTNKAAVV